MTRPPACRLCVSICWLIGCAGVATCLTFATGCSNDSIDVHRSVPVTRDLQGDDSNVEKNYRMITAIADRPDATWYVKMSGPVEDVGNEQAAWVEFLKSVKFGDDEPTWTLPEGWSGDGFEDMGAAGLSMRIANVGTTHELVAVSVSSLPAGQELLLNVNRWRRQLGLGPTNELRLVSQLGAVKTDQTIFKVFDASGPELNTGMGGGAPFANRPRANPPRNPAPPSQAETENDTRSITFAAPDQWTAGEASTFVAGRWTRETDDGFAEVMLMNMNPSDESWTMNVQAWANQVKMPETPEVGDITESYEVAGTTGRKAVLTGTDPEQPDVKRTVVAVMFESPNGDGWVVKLAGNKATIESLQEEFESFLQSISFADSPPRPGPDDDSGVE